MAQQQYWSGSVNFAGLGNGTDFGKIVEGMVKTQSFHKRRLERWKQGWEDKSKELLNLNAKVLNLRTVLKKMDTTGELLGKQISSSDSGVVTAEASGSASFNSHKVQVKQLATADHWSSQGEGFEELSSKLVASNATFKFSYAGKSVELNVPQNTTLEQFVQNINNHKDLRGKVRASAVSDGNRYFLQLKGLNLGAENAIMLSNSGVPGLQPSSFTNIQSAQDALLKVDGFPPGTDKWMRRSTNTINDALEGVTLNLKSAKPNSTVDITIAHDQNKTKEKVQEFLKAMNEVRVQVKKLTEVSSQGKDKAKGSILTGNYGVEMVSQRLKMAISSPGMGFELAGDHADLYSALAAIGITSDANSGSASFRQLKLDETVFDKALKDNPEAVTALFITDHTMTTQSTDFVPGSILKNVTPAGKHQVQYSVSAGKITGATINGKAAKISGWEITGTHDNARGMSFNVTNQADGTYSGTINVRLGKIHELIQDIRELTDPNNGTLKLIEKNYKSIIENIDKKIERETIRIAGKERRLKLRFSRLDATLGRYDKMQAALKSQIAKLG